MIQGTHDNSTNCEWEMGVENLVLWHRVTARFVTYAAWPRPAVNEETWV